MTDGDWRGEKKHFSLKLSEIKKINKYVIQKGEKKFCLRESCLDYDTTLLTPQIPLTPHDVFLSLGRGNDAWFLSNGMPSMDANTKLIITKIIPSTLVALEMFFLLKVNKWSIGVFDCLKVFFLTGLLAKFSLYYWHDAPILIASLPPSPDS